MSDDMDENDLGMGSGFDDEGLEDFEGGTSSSFGEMARENPLVKIGIVLGAFATIIGGVILFGGGNKVRDVNSTMQARGGVSTVPGTEELPIAYREALEEKNEEIIEEAIKTGQSAIPTPITTAREYLALENEEVAAEDPLERWRRLQQERQHQIVQKPKKPEVDQAPSIEALAEAMASQMASILSGLKPRKAQYETVSSVDFLEEDEEKIISGNDDDDDEILTILLPAGTIEYAQLMTEATSDAPGPIMAQLVSGPLKGSRLLGDFEVTEEKYLTLDFSVIVIDGVSHKMKAVALDPETVSPGLVTEIDHRYFKRVILPAAAAFIEGFGEAVADAGSTTVTVDGGAAVTATADLGTKEEFFKGIGEATSIVSDFVDEEAKKTHVLVRVAAGTPLGLLFLKPVLEEK